MPRVQAIVCREDRVLMVKHRLDGSEWWCLPGGAQERNETPMDGALRELREECCVEGTVVRQTAHAVFAPGDEAHTFLVDIGDQEPALGCDPDVPAGCQVLAEARWMRLRDVPERDRCFLWAAGLLGVGRFLAEVSAWGDALSCPGL